MSLVGGSDARNVELIGLGGSFRKLTRSFVGPETVREIQSFFVDRLVLSVTGIEAEGFLTDPDPLEAEVKRAMIDHARTVVLACVHQGAQTPGPSVIAGVDRVDAAFLAGASDDDVETLASGGRRSIGSERDPGETAGDTSIYAVCAPSAWSSSSPSTRSSAVRFCSRCSSGQVPGIGSIAGDLARSHASATCAVVTPCRPAISARAGPPTPRSGKYGTNAMPSRSQ